MSRKEDDGLILAGDVYVRNRRIEGAGFVHIGNTTAFTIQSSSEVLERKSKQKNSYGQVLDSITTPNPTTISFSLDTFDRHNLALALMGEDSDIVSTAQTIADEPVVIAQKGQWYKLANARIDAATVVVKNANDAAIDAAAYEINAITGMLSIKPESSTVAAGDTVSVSYETAAGSGFKIAAGTLIDFDLELRIDGTNRVNGKTNLLEIPSAKVSADSEIDWFGDEFASASFSGNIVTESGKAPYTFTQIES